MGWFLSKPKSKVKASKAKTSPRTAAKVATPWDPQRTLAGLKACGLVLLLIAAGYGWRWSEGALRNYVARKHPTPVRAEQVAFVNAPAWISPLLMGELQTQAAAWLSGDPLDGRSLRKTMLSLSHNPWVTRVDRVSRGASGKVEVWASFREPVAIVEGLDGYHLVDAGAVRLPGLYVRSQLSRLGLPVIVGTAGAPRGEGEVWPGGDLRAGLDLALLMRGEPYANQVREIDVSRRDSLGRMRLVMHTTTGGAVNWGLPPGQERPVEPDAQTKKNWLANVYLQRGAIDAGGKIVDVYGAAVFVRQPAAPGGTGGPGGHSGGDETRSVGYTWSR